MNTPLLSAAMLAGLVWLALAARYPRQVAWFVLLWIPVQGWFQLNVLNDSSTTVLIYEFQMIGIYFVLGIKALRSPQRYGPPKEVWLAAPFVVWALMLIPYSVEANGALVTLLGLRALVLPLPLVWVGYRAFENRRELKNVATMMMLQLPIIALVTAWQFMQYTTSSGRAFELPLGFSDVGILRPPGTFSAPGHLGMYVLFAVPVGIGLLGLTVNAVIRTIFSAGLVGATVALMVNTQRATMVLLVGVLPLMVLLARKKHAVRNVLIAFCVLGAGAAIGGRVAGQAFSARVASISIDVQNSLINIPLERITDSLRTPVVGGGLGIAAPGAARVNVPLGMKLLTPAASIKPSESFTAALIFETGVPGFLLFVVFIATLLFRGLRALRRCRHTDLGLLAAAVVAFEVAICLQSWAYDPLHFPPSRVVFWFWAGALLSFPRLAAPRAAVSSPSLKRTLAMPVRRLRRPPVPAAARRSAS